ncbi:MAG TPA: AAA family ATPase [Streptosporangiaceae bacterium]|nr:AAA family ATPase [Streptosporangiaceae bacterium]
MKVFVAMDSGSPPRLQLRLAGPFGVVREGTALPDGEIGSRKARTLLKLLAVERPGHVPVERIIETLWDDEPPAAAEQNVATLVSRLRAALGPGVVLGGRRAYRLGAGPGVSVDLDQAASFCERSEHTLDTAPALALAAAERALGLLSAGTALADEPYAAWADPARDEVRALLRRARLAAAAAALATGAGLAAMGYAEQAMTADPLDEQAHRWYMSAAAAAGEPGRALTAYAALSRRLADELGSDPAPQTQDLHLAILRERRAGPPSAATGGMRPRAGPAGPVPAGRDAEIGALRSAWRAAAGGEPGLVVIVGEAGIGKTTLAGFVAAEAEADGGTVLRTRCYETERSLFLQPIVEALTPVVAALPADVLRGMLGEHAPAAAALLPDAAAVLGPLPLWRGSVDSERRRAFEAVLALLRGLAARSPVLLLVDDLQNAGRSTIELLHYLGRRGAAARLLVLVTCRTEDDARVGAALAPVARRLELGPLGPGAVDQLARAAGQGPLAERILRRTGGHTLFVVEVLRALAGGETGVPDSLRGAITERVRRTGPATEALLRAAAVLGTAIDPLALATLLDLPPARALELCELALKARLLVVSGRDYEFANDLIREVLYVTTPEPARLAQHRRAADLLTGQPEPLARHAAAAGDWLRAARAWLLAAEDAMRRYAATDAASLATQALEAAERCEDDEVAARAAFVRGRAREVSGELAAALGDLNQAAAGARAAGDRRMEMLALRELGGDVPVSQGQTAADNAATLERGLRIAESLGDRAAQADFLSRLAILAANRLRYGAALDCGLRAVTAGRAARDDQALAVGLDGLKTVYGGLGDLPALRAVLDELVPLTRRLGDLFRLQWVEFESAFLSVAAADWDGAVTAMQAGIEANRRGGYPHWAAWYVAHLGWLARLRGHDDEALAQGRRALAMTERHPHNWLRAGACAMLGGTLLVTGDRPAAIDLLERGLRAAEAAEVEAYVLRCAAPLAAATGSRAMLARAAGLLEAATMPEGGAWVLGDECYLAIARAWLGRDEPERARAVLAPLLAQAQRGPWIATEAATLAVDGQALIRLGQAGPAGTALRAAGALARAHGLPHVLREARAAQSQLR